jgi:hypothetical protein
MQAPDTTECGGETDTVDTGDERTGRRGTERWWTKVLNCLGHQMY